MSDVALSVSVRRPRLSLKAPVAAPAAIRKKVVRIAKTDKTDAAPDRHARRAARPAGDRAGVAGVLLGRIAEAAEILQAASDGVTSLRKWVAVARSIANLMREADSAFGASEGALASAKVSQVLLASLVGQYNGVLAQIDAIAGDAACHGINLLNGDVLTLAFDETGTSTLSIAGALWDAAGLGLSPLPGRRDIGMSIEAMLSALQAAAASLRARAQTLASNLSIVQSRRQLHANLMDAPLAGAPDPARTTASEEAANSLALSSRQSIATSALALAKESQTSILRLLNRTRYYAQQG